MAKETSPNEAKVMTTEKILKNPLLKRFRENDLNVLRKAWTKKDILDLLLQGVTHADIADTFNIPRTVVAKVLKESISEEKRTLLGDDPYEVNSR